MASTICSVPENYPDEIIGYAVPWIASPGDEVEIKVRTDGQGAVLFQTSYSWRKRSSRAHAAKLYRSPQRPRNIPTGLSDLSRAWTRRTLPKCGSRRLPPFLLVRVRADFNRPIPDLTLSSKASDSAPRMRE